MNKENRGLIIVSLTISLVTISAILLVLLFCHSVTYKAKFTTDDWVNAKDKDKYHYVDDLLDHYDLVGKTSQDIESLLGKTYFYTQDDIWFSSYIDTETEDIDAFCCYRIEDHPLAGWRILLIKFKNNIVVDVEESIEIAG